MKGTATFKNGKYSQQELDILFTYYPKYGTQGKKGCVARLSKIGFERTAKSLNQKARKLRLTYESIRVNRFKKGHTPHNKGKAMAMDTKAKLVNTFFKKGHTPHNTKNDGALSFRINKRTGIGYWFIRIDKANWVLLNRYLFEQHHKIKLKPHQLIRFKDGDTNNVTVGNLELMTKIKNLFKNNPRLNYSDEILTAMASLSQLQKQIRYATEQIE